MTKLLTPEMYWPLAWPHNRPLHEQMAAKGWSFAIVHEHEFYQDSEGAYHHVPVGFVTYGLRPTRRYCPETAWQASVYLPTGRWAKYYMPTAIEAIDLATTRGAIELAGHDGK